MRRNAFLSVSLLIFTALFCSAQAPPIEWGEIPSEDLSMTTYEPAPDAGAVILCDYGNIYFDINQRGTVYKFKRHKRIKILNRNGFDQADVEIPYHKNQSLTNLKAQIITPDGTVTSLEKDAFYEEKINANYRNKKWAFPNVTEGAILEYSYQIQSEYLVTLREWYFQDFIPTRWSELRFSMIEWFYYLTIQTGTHPLVINEKTTEGKNYSGYSATANNYRWAMEKLPGLERESHTYNYFDYASKMQFQLKNINLPYSYNVPFLDTWGKIAAVLFDDMHFGRQYLKKGANKKLIEAAAPTMAKAQTEMEKVQAAYDFVNKNIKWNGRYYPMTNTDINAAYAKKTAYSGELNLMVLALLKAHKINAFPVLISTKSHGKINQLYPLLGQFNHTLILAEVDGKEMWIDAGDVSRPIGLPAVQSLNMEGLLIDDVENAFRWVPLTPPSTKDVMMLTMTLTEEDQINATVSCSHTGYSAHKERKSCGDSDGKSQWENRLSNMVPDAKVTSINLVNKREQQKTLKGKMDIELPGAAVHNGDIIYVSPIPYSKILENPFKSEKRTSPIEFDYPFNEQIIINIFIPEGYQIDGAPENMNVSLPEDAGSFQYRLSEAQGKIQIISKYQLKHTFFLPSDYPTIRNFHTMIEEKLGEQIVLKKQP